jgi:hypothetical protein
MHPRVWRFMDETRMERGARQIAPGSGEPLRL